MVYGCYKWFCGVQSPRCQEHFSCAGRVESTMLPYNVWVGSPNKKHSEVTTWGSVWRNFFTDKKVLPGIRILGVFWVGQKIGTFVSNYSIRAQRTLTITGISCLHRVFYENEYSWFLDLYIEWFYLMFFRINIPFSAYPPMPEDSGYKNWH